MSRKEMIIAAVLVNAGLLTLLFATALKSDRGSEALVKEGGVAQQAIEMVAKNQEPVVVGSDVDKALQTIASVSAPLPSPGAPAMESVANANSFVEEIKSIATQESAQAPSLPAVQTLMAPLQKEGRKVVEVKVKKGDVLEKIARHNHSTVQEIMQANQLSNSNLKIGQVLKIPQKEEGSVIAATTTPIKPAAPSSQTGAKWYEVKKGDSPWTIAVKNHVKVEDLLRLNQMTEEQAKRLKPGDKIRIQ